jgi:hypothetical protein
VEFTQTPHSWLYLMFICGTAKIEPTHASDRPLAIPAHGFAPLFPRNIVPLPNLSVIQRCGYSGLHFTMPSPHIHELSGASVTRSFFVQLVYLNGGTRNGNGNPWSGVLLRVPLKLAAAKSLSHLDTSEPSRCVCTWPCCCHDSQCFCKEVAASLGSP